MLCDVSRVADHLVVVVDVGGPEVDENVHDEHDVHHQVHHVERVAGVAAGPPPLLLHLVEKESSRVRCEDCSVDDQQQDDPVPYRFEWAVVQDGPFVDAWGLELVLWQHISTEGQHLRTQGRDGEDVRKAFRRGLCNHEMICSEMRVYFTTSDSWDWLQPSWKKFKSC